MDDEKPKSLTGSNYVSVTETGGKPLHELPTESRYESWKKTHPMLEFDSSIDPQGTIYWWWTALPALACAYNLWSVVMLVFEDFRGPLYRHWLVANAVADVINLLDIVVQSRLSFYEDGCEVVTWREMLDNYLRSWRFGLDLMALLPTDLLLIIRPDVSLLRVNRLCKVYRLIEMFDNARHRIKQVVVSIARVICVCGVLFHWNACAFYILSAKSHISDWDVNATFDDDVTWPWPYIPEKITNFVSMKCPSYGSCHYDELYYDEEKERNIGELLYYWRNRSQVTEFSSLAKEYAVSMYWSSLTMTTLGEQPPPNESFQSLFEILDTIVGMVIFAAIMGSVGDLVQNANKVESGWKQLMDGLKQYMEYRSLDDYMQRRVLKYCEYEVSKRETFKEGQMRDCLPAKLYHQVNQSLHWTTIGSAPLFVGCEPPFLKDLTTRFHPMDFGPGDYVCAKGDLNRELYLVCSGELLCVSPEGLEEGRVMAGDVIGDRHLVWFDESRSGNRRTINVISRGYSEVLFLSRDDFREVLMDFPHLRAQIRERARTLQLLHGELPSSREEAFHPDDETVEKRLRDIEETLAVVARSIDIQYEQFVETSGQFKRRIFVLEKAFQELAASKKTREKTKRFRI